MLYMGKIPYISRPDMHCRHPLALAFAALFLALCPTVSRAQTTQLLLDGTFATINAIPANSYSQNVGIAGSGATYIFTNNAPWQTTESDNRFEVWTPGFMSSPTGVGNTLELASSEGGDTISQTVTSVMGTTAAVFSFGYSTRDNGNDAFTVTVTDVTRGGTLVSQSFNPTGSFATVNTFSQNLTIIPGDQYLVAFKDQNTVGSNGTPGARSAHIDQVSFLQTVPEPSTYLVMAAGAGMLLTVRRKFRSR